MKNIFGFVIIAILATACGDETKKEPIKTTIEVKANEAFAKLLEEFYQGGLKLRPIDATYSGDNRYNDYFPNMLSEEYKAEEKAFYTKYKTELTTYKNLTASEELSKGILTWDCDINLDRLKFNEDLTPINQMWTIHLTMAQFASGESAQPFATVADYNNWLKRLDGYLAWISTAQEKMKKGIAVKHVLPKSLIKKVLPHLEGIATEPLETHLFYKPILNLPESFSKEDKEALTASYTSMLTEKVIPAYSELHAFMSTDYLTAGRETTGISDTPDGKAYYAHQIKLNSTTNMSAKEIHDLGLKEVERISTEMEKVKQQVNYEGDLISFFDFVRENKELMPYKDAQQIIDNFNTIHETMKPQLEKLFGMTPKTAFEVRRTEAFREKTASAEYQPGTKDGNRPGIFYTPIPDVTKYNVFSDEALFLHEAIPGHHYQVSLTQENQELPEFRKTLWYSAYGEGWALYTEALGKELGLYTDPYQYFGMLSMEMHRAIRLVVDPGMHVLGWSREKSIQYSLDHEAEPESSIISEIERYMANPGQAVSYKIGQLKIRELRARAEKTLGDKFDIRQFHNQVLETGCVPLALLESKIDKWIAASK
jgi:uncharacterized protein (DUF885 family)